MDSTNHYQVLGVPFGATPEEIKAAYGVWLGRLREGMNGGGGPAPDFLDALRRAYKVLSDPSARRDYDAGLGAGPATPFPGWDAAQTVVAASPGMAGAGRARMPAAWGDAADRPPAARTAETAEAGDAARYPMEFTGSGGEYFRIWIVNLLLSIITLGIYSAWAKVRREQYFHRNLLLDGSGFDYHGEALAILKGRAVAFGLFMLLSLAQNLGPIPYLIALGLFIPAVPWFAVRAFRFRAHNTSYRGLRLSFHGTYRQALTVFVGYGLLSMLSFGLLFPAFFRQQKKFVLDNLRYGSASFACAAGLGAFYRIFLLPIGALALLGIAMAASTWGMRGVSGGSQGAMAGLMITLMVAFFVTQLLFIPYVQVKTTNLIWNTATLGAHRFESSLGLWGYVGVVVSNWLLTIITLGLFWPWAKVRMARYRAAHMVLLATCDLDEFVAGEATSAAALGDEAAEMFDMDVAL